MNTFALKIRKNPLCLLTSCYSKVDYSDLLFDTKCFFIIPLLDSHLDRYDTQNKSQADLWNSLLRVTVQK